MFRSILITLINALFCSDIFVHMNQREKKVKAEMDAVYSAEHHRMEQETLGREQN